MLLEGVSRLQAAMYHVYILDKCSSDSTELASKGSVFHQTANNEEIVIWGLVNLVNKYLFSLHCVLSKGVDTRHNLVDSVLMKVTFKL